MNKNSLEHLEKKVDTLEENLMGVYGLYKHCIGILVQEQKIIQSIIKQNIVSTQLIAKLMKKIQKLEKK